MATTPAEILDTTKMVAITAATAINSSLKSMTVSIIDLTFLPHSTAAICELVKPSFKPSLPVKPSTKLVMTGTTLVKMYSVRAVTAGNKAAPTCSFVSSIAIVNCLNLNAAVVD